MFNATSLHQVLCYSSWFAFTGFWSICLIKSMTNAKMLTSNDPNGSTPYPKKVPCTVDPSTLFRLIPTPACSGNSMILVGKSSRFLVCLFVTHFVFWAPQTDHNLGNTSPLNLTSPSVSPVIICFIGRIHQSTSNICFKPNIAKIDGHTNFKA